MTADEARGIVSDAREALRSVMRAINRPEPDWKVAEEAASECVRMSAELQSRCWLNEWKERHGDR